MAVEKERLHLLIFLQEHKFNLRGQEEAAQEFQAVTQEHKALITLEPMELHLIKQAETFQNLEHRLELTEVLKV